MAQGRAPLKARKPGTMDRTKRTIEKREQRYRPCPEEQSEKAELTMVVWTNGRPTCGTLPVFPRLPMITKPTRPSSLATLSLGSLARSVLFLVHSSSGGLIPAVSSARGDPADMDSSARAKQTRPSLPISTNGKPVSPSPCAARGIST